MIGVWRIGTNWPFLGRPQSLAQGFASSTFGDSARLQQESRRISVACDVDEAGNKASYSKLGRSRFRVSGAVEISW